MWPCDIILHDDTEKEDCRECILSLNKKATPQENRPLARLLSSCPAHRHQSLQLRGWKPPEESRRKEREEVPGPWSALGSGHSSPGGLQTPPFLSVHLPVRVTPESAPACQAFPTWDFPLGQAWQAVWRAYYCLKTLHCPFPLIAFPERERWSLPSCPDPTELTHSGGQLFSPRLSLLGTEGKFSTHSSIFFSFEYGIPVHCHVLIISFIQSSFGGCYKSIFSSLC